MARITSPTDLRQVDTGVGEVIFNTTNFTIQLVTEETTGITDSNVDDGGVTLQALYSFAKIEWREDDDLIRFPFPFIAITGEQFELINGWDFADVETKNLIRDAGWALRNTSGVIIEEYMNITSLGLFDDPNVDQAYYLQEDGGVPTQVVLTGEVNQAIQIFAGPSDGDFDYRDFFRIYLREQGKIYGFYDLIVEQNIPALTFRKYALPLVNSIDLKITASDNDIENNAPYTGMSISYYTTAQEREIGGIDYDFNIIIDGNNGTAEQIYEFVQWSLRQPIDINDETPPIRRGDTAEELLQFIGDTLRTRLTEDGGVFIDNFQAADTNRLEFTDNTGTIRIFPFVAAGNIIFNDNLQNDTDAKYFVFFTNDAAGNNAGFNFGTVNAILINDNSGSPLTDDVGGVPSKSFDYDYDGNVQRGAASAGTDAPFTAVSLGLNTAQYVVTTGTIVRSTANVINFVAALERNFVA